MFRTGWVHVFIGRLVVGFLKQNVGADAGFLELAVIFHGGRCNVDVDAADGAVFVLHAVNGFDALQHIFNRNVDRVFTGFQRQAFVPHILKSYNFAADFVLCELFARHLAVGVVISAVTAGIHALVGQIERRKEYNAVAVNVLFDFHGDAVHLLHGFLVPCFHAFQQQRHLFVIQPFEFLRAFQNGADGRFVRHLLFGFVYAGQNFFVADELFRVFGF